MSTYFSFISIQAHQSGSPGKAKFMHTEDLRNQLGEVYSQINQLMLYVNNSARPDQTKIWKELCTLEATLQLILYLLAQEKAQQ